jgi:hypothetical protein
VLQNSPAVNLDVFPQPRLQTNDAGEMTRFLNSENALLNAKQPFADSSGTIHIPIAMAMQLIVERGLPVRPNPPPPDVNTQTEAGNVKMLNVEPGSLGETVGAGNKAGGAGAPGNPAGGANAAAGGATPARGQQRPQ